jgi:hypothetical protein
MAPTAKAATPAVIRKPRRRRAAESSGVMGMGGEFQDAVDEDQRHKGHKSQRDEQAALAPRLGGDWALAEGIAGSAPS